MIQWWVWLLVAGILIIVEMFTLTFALLACAIAAIVTALLNHLGASLPVQWICFGAVSFIIFFILKKNPHTFSPKVPQNFGSERIVGSEAIVSEDIDSSHGKGMINVMGETWRAIAKENIIKGTSVIVEKLDGTKAVVSIKKEE